MAKGLAPTANRAKVTGTVTEKLTNRLVALGLSERKAKTLATGLAPVVRASIKAKVKKAKIKLDDVDDAFVNEIVNEGVDLSEDADLDKVAPRVNGHRVRLDLPVVRRSVWQSKPTKGIELLRVMDGLTSEATYLAAAVKSDVGIVAVRQLGGNFYNVKFYPDMRTEAVGNQAGGDGCRRASEARVVRADALRPGYVESPAGAVGVRSQAQDHAAPVAVSGGDGRTLVKAFDYLHKRKGIAA